MANFNHTLVKDNTYIEKDTTNDQAYYDRAMVYFQRQEFDLALDDLNKAIRLNPTNYSAYYYRGLIYKNEIELDKALKDLIKYIKHYPDDFNAHGIWAPVTSVHRIYD